MKSAPRTFFSGTTEKVAQRLLGAVLVHDSPDGRCAGRIVETEAYLADDPAAHSFRGPTKRNASMFLDAGRAYVYLIYGVHHCFNVVTAPEGTGEAVLVRALEPLEGLELMRSRRGTSHDRNLCSGPGKLVQALGIDRTHDGCDLRRGDVRICLPREETDFGIAVTPRIGITKAQARELRYFVDGSAHVSR